jgi:two-component system OmpR family sensor kinase
MDGLKTQLMHSLQLRLTLWLSIAILTIAAMAGGLSFHLAFEEAHELQDDTLRQIAALFDQSQLHIPQESQSLQWDIDNADDSHVIVQRLWPPSSTAHIALPLPTTITDGLHTLIVGHDTYQVLVHTLKNHERLAVAQNIDIRDKIAKKSVLHAFIPFLILIPIFLLMIPLLVRRMLQPVSHAAAEVDQRDQQDLSPIQLTHLASEIRPFVRAINQLLHRTASAIQAQRRFVADAAHELRSPLTALSLQAEALATCDLSTLAQTRLQALRQGIERTKTLLEQLLALAHAQATVQQPVRLYSVQYVYRQVLEDLMPLAEHKNIDIGVTTCIDITLPIHQFDLFNLVRNLVDNAIRYTPNGGRVDLSIEVSATALTLVVEDNGVGIAVSERERVFDPFYRVLGSGEIGSGLGLSIVSAIALRQGAVVQLSAAQNASTGLRVLVIFRRRD